MAAPNSAGRTALARTATSTPGWGGNAGHTDQIQPDAQNNYFVMIKQFSNKFATRVTHRDPWHYYNHINDDV